MLATGRQRGFEDRSRRCRFRWWRWVLASPLAMLMFMSAPAFAAGPPEAPETGAATAVEATTATLEGGVLNPHAPGKTLQPGEFEEYTFFYAPGGEPCNPPVAVAPEPFGMVGEKEKELVFPAVVLTGLVPNTLYTVCLAARYPGEGWTFGPSITFTTLPPPPAPPEVSGESASSVTASGARLEGSVNPNNQSTECHFQYGSTSVTEDEVLCEQSPIAGGVQGVGVSLVGLKQDTTYHYRILAKNATGPGEGIEEAFTTLPEAPGPVPAEVTSSSATLKGILNPKEAGEEEIYEFLYKQSAIRCEVNEAAEPGVTQLRTPEPPSTALSHKEEPVSAPLSGLQPGTTYTYCLRVINKAGGSTLGPPVTFTTLAVPPTIGEELTHEEPFSNVGSSSATLHAEINPGGAPTTYFFQYGQTTGYGLATPIESAGAGYEILHVLANLHELQPNTVYHFHVVVTNAKGTVEGKDHSFSTFPLGTLGLPDGRSYELVSSLNNGDATVALPDFQPTPPVRAAADGSAIAYIGTPPPAGGNGNGQNGHTGLSTEEGDNEYLAQRSLTYGWISTDIQPYGLNQTYYQSFSGDLSSGILRSPQALTTSAPGEGYNVLYLRSTDDGSYSPLFKKRPSHDVPSEFEVTYAGSSLDSSHQLFEVDEALLEGGSSEAEELNADARVAAIEKSKLEEEADKLEEEGHSSEAETKRAFALSKLPHVLYDSVNDRLSVISVLPDGQIATPASFGADLGRVISADGSRIFWTAMEGFGFERRVKALYVRENDSQPQSPLGAKDECLVTTDACTVQVDASQVPSEEGGGGVFQTASSDGSRVFFTDEHRLTSDSTATAGRPDLYEYDVNNQTGKPGTLTDLTVNSTEPANVSGVLGASEDGTYVYFAAAGALAPGSKPQECLPGNKGTECNVYAVHESEPPVFVATVTEGDGDGGAVDGRPGPVLPLTAGQRSSVGDWVPTVGLRSSYVTPDGHHLVFESIEGLTGFDSGGGREVYIYDYGSGLSCVSCNPSGAPTIVGGEAFHADAELPESFNSTYALRAVSTDGDRVFFDSKEALVSQDENGQADVYEWERPVPEPEPDDSCMSSSESFSKGDGGCLYLLSGGTSTDASAFLDASENGNDVFIATSAHLVSQDEGEVYEVYDARECTNASPPCVRETPTACTEAGCQGVPSAPPIFATPSSATFNGVGNFPPATGSKVKSLTRAQKLVAALKACKKDKSKKKRTGCEKSARKKYGPPKIKKASDKRQASDRRGAKS
jgi:hypothetical protein